MPHTVINQTHSRSMFFKALATFVTAEICGMPTPLITRVVQIEPGPLPTLTASAPAFYATSINFFALLNLPL